MITIYKNDWREQAMLTLRPPLLRKNDEARNKLLIEFEQQLIELEQQFAMEQAGKEQINKPISAENTVVYAKKQKNRSWAAICNPIQAPIINSQNSYVQAPGGPRVTG